MFVSNCTYDSINLIATSSSEKLIEARQDEFLKVEEPSDSDGLDLPPAGLFVLQESHVADQSDDLLPPPPGPPAMPTRLAPKPKSSGSSDAAASSDWFKSFLEPKSPDDPPPGWVPPSDTGGKGKSDEVKSDEVGGKSDEVKSDEVGKGQGKSDEVKSDEVGKGQGKSDQGKSDKGQGKSDKGKSDEVGKGQGKSDKGKSDEVGKGQGKSESDHRKRGFWYNLPMASGPQMAGIPCPVMLLGAKLSSRINCVGHENQ